MSGKYLFTSESVTEGHPDKGADCISDAILDAILAQDPDSRVACETMITGAKDKESLKVFISGEITSDAIVDYSKIAKQTLFKNINSPGGHKIWCRPAGPAGPARPAGPAGPRTGPAGRTGSLACYFCV